MPFPLVIALLVVGSSLSAAPAAGQQDAAAVPENRPAAADTIPGDSALTMRERALQRLRALPATPVQPDTAAADTALEPGDGEEAVRAGGDAEATEAEAAEPGAAGQAEAADVAAGEAGVSGAEGAVRPGEERPEPVRVAPGDTLVVFTDDDDGPDRLLSEDSVLALLRSLPGYESIEYTGEEAVFEAEANQLELTGASKIGRGQSALETDSLLVYDGESGIVCGFGEPVLTGEAEPIESDELCFDIDRDLGVARGARTRFQQGATWFVRGAENRVYLLTGGEKNALYGEGTEFTSCELDHPHYTFRARSVKMVEDEVMVARDVTLRFQDVPVFWLPWMVQSMKRDRRSGLLMPEFGVNDIVRNSTGYNRHLSNIGFYWAVNDYVSTKATFEWYSGNWTALEGALTYRWLRQFLQGNLTVKQFWRQQEGLPATRELTLNTSNSWQPDERTRLQLNANYASSSDFVRQNSFDPRELNRRITSTASIGRTFDWGSVNFGADRQEQLSTGQVDMTLPSLNVSLSPITLFSNGEGLDLVWNGSGSATRRVRDVAPDTARLLRDEDDVSARLNHRLSLGNLSLNQSANWADETESLLRVGPDSVLPEENEQRLDWSTSVSYQQALWPGTTVSPTLSISGNQLRNDSTGGVFVAEPTRISTGASLQTAIYGFWPGFGNFSRIRHKISPSVRWSYSPSPEVTELQERIFGATNLRERNEVTLSFNQTFEAKVREEGVDTVAADTAVRTDGEPRRLPQAEKVTLLALNTGTAFQYDFVAADEEGRGFRTESVSNSIRSDLLDGLQLSMTHDLFRESAVLDGDGLAPRTFDPFLTQLRASFSIDNDFWLFRTLGLTRRAAADEDFPDTEAEGVANSEDPEVGAESDPDRRAGGSIVPNRGPQGDDARRGGGLGRWRASLNYSLQRQRPGAVGGGGAEANQQVNGNISFQPTELWSVRWSTAYSFTDQEFANHVLTLTRDLHRWTANFDFIKAQNGNFAMQFRVQLRDNPDLKLDYDQRTDPSERLGTGF